LSLLLLRLILLIIVAKSAVDILIRSSIGISRCRWIRFRRHTHGSFIIISVVVVSIIRIQLISIVIVINCAVLAVSNGWIRRRSSTTTAVIPVVRREQPIWRWTAPSRNRYSPHSWIYFNLKLSNSLLLLEINCFVEVHIRRTSL